MNKRTCTLGVLLLILISVLSYVSAQEPTVDLPSKKNFHLFLLAGQSNMAGRGEIEEQDRVAHPRVLMLSEDREWIPAVAPIHFDKTVAGVGLGKSFAIALAEANPGITIGLIPAACGGSPIESWEPGGFHKQTQSPPYDDAISRTRTALKDGTLKGILWQSNFRFLNFLARTRRSLGGLFDVRHRGDLDIQRGPFARSGWFFGSAIIRFWTA